MSANNFILIKEEERNTYKVSENDYESNRQIQNIGTFDLLRTAIEKAEEYIANSEMEIEYGIRFDLNKIKEIKKISKDFDSWNEKKKILDQKEVSDQTFFNEREIWWGSLGLNIGYEQDGKNNAFERPLLIIKKFNRYIVWVVPLTTIAKDNEFHYKLKRSGSFIILSQIRLVSTKRLLRLVETINENEFKEIISKIKNFFP